MPIDHTLLEVEVVRGDARNQIALVAHGAEITLGAVEHGEMATIVVRAVDVVKIKDAHRSACVLVHICAFIHPVHKSIPQAVGELTGGNFIVGEFISGLGSDKT